MKKKKGFFVISPEMYPFDVLFSVGNTEKELIRYIEKNRGYKLCKEELAVFNFKGNGRTIKLLGNQNIVWLKYWSYSFLAHEILHLAYNIFLTIGARVNDETEEPFAYLIQYLTGKIICEAHKKGLAT